MIVIFLKSVWASLDTFHWTEENDAILNSKNINNNNNNSNSNNINIQQNVVADDKKSVVM